MSGPHYTKEVDCTQCKGFRGNTDCWECGGQGMYSILIYGDPVLYEPMLGIISQKIILAMRRMVQEEEARGETVNGIIAV